MPRSRQDSIRRHGREGDAGQIDASPRRQQHRLRPSQFRAPSTAHQASRQAWRCRHSTLRKIPLYATLSEFIGSSLQTSPSRCLLLTVEISLPASPVTSGISNTETKENPRLPGLCHFNPGFLGSDDSLGRRPLHWLWGPKVTPAASHSLSSSMFSTNSLAPMRLG